MKDTIYFRHDYNAHGDPKMIKLRISYWREWYWLFWATLEMMREDTEVVLRRWDCNAYAYRLQYDPAKYEKFLFDCVGFWLFQFDEKDEVFYSERLQEDVECMREKSSKASASAKIRRSKRKKKDANALRSECKGNAIKESIGEEEKEKEKESKGEEIIFTPAPTDFSENVIMSDQEKTALEKIYGSSATQDYITRLGTHIASKWDKFHSHYATILSWMRQDKVRLSSWSALPSANDPPPKPLTDEQKQAIKERMQNTKNKLTA